MTFVLTNNLLIWKPHETAPDRYRQIPRSNLEMTKNMRIATFPTILEEVFKEAEAQKNDKVLNNFWIDVKRLKLHLIKVSHLIPALTFFGESNEKVYPLHLLEKHPQKVFGNITLGLRADYRNEKVINFGKKTGIRGYERPTPLEKDFENLVFMGLFGGVAEKGSKKQNLNFIELIINLETKEIYHQINEESLNKFRNYLDIKENVLAPVTYDADTFKHEPNVDVWDYSIEDHESKPSEIINISRQSNLSQQHRLVQIKLVKHFINQENHLVKAEKYGVIDLYVENETDAYLFEIKTSHKEIYKAIGQVMAYEQLAKDKNPNQKKITKIILFDREYDFSNHILKIIKKLDIEIKNLKNYLNQSSKPKNISKSE